MHLVSQPREAIAQWLFNHFPEKHERMASDFRALAAVDGQRILGAVIYDCFYARDCNVSLAIEDKRCVTREVLRAVFAYPFVQLALPRISASVDASNAASLCLMHRWGFRKEGVKRGAGIDGGDEILFGMLRNECRWIA